MSILWGTNCCFASFLCLQYFIITTKDEKQSPKRFFPFEKFYLEITKIKEEGERQNFGTTVIFNSRQEMENRDVWLMIMSFEAFHSYYNWIGSNHMLIKYSLERKLDESSFVSWVDWKYIRRNFINLLTCCQRWAGKGFKLKVQKSNWNEKNDLIFCFQWISCIWIHEEFFNFPVRYFLVHLSFFLQIFNNDLSKSF